MLRLQSATAVVCVCRSTLLHAAVAPSIPSLQSAAASPRCTPLHAAAAVRPLPSRRHLDCLPPIRYWLLVETVVIMLTQNKDVLSYLLLSNINWGRPLHLTLSNPPLLVVLTAAAFGYPPLSCLRVILCLITLRRPLPLSLCCPTPNGCCVIHRWIAFRCSPPDRLAILHQRMRSKNRHLLIPPAAPFNHQWQTKSNITYYSTSCPSPCGV